MPVPPIQGPTLFLGDSITVGLPPYVKVDGAKTYISLGGQTSTWLLDQVKKAEAAGKLDGSSRPVNAVMLIGTNDVGGGLSYQQSVANIVATWTILKAHGIRVIAQTVPPFHGYKGYVTRYDAIEAKRQGINAAVLALAGRPNGPDVVIPLATLVEDPARPGYLLRSYDAGDGIHLRKDAHGALINAQLAGLPAPAPPPAGPTVEVSSAGSPLLGSSLVPFIVLGGILMTGAVLLARKRHR